MVLPHFDVLLGMGSSERTAPSAPKTKRPGRIVPPGPSAHACVQSELVSQSHAGSERGESVGKGDPRALGTTTTHRRVRNHVWGQLMREARARVNSESRDRRYSTLVVGPVSVRTAFAALVALPARSSRRIYAFFRLRGAGRDGIVGPILREEFARTQPSQPTIGPPGSRLAGLFLGLVLSHDGFRASRCRGPAQFPINVHYQKN